MILNFRHVADRCTVSPRYRQIHKVLATFATASATSLLGALSAVIVARLLGPSQRGELAAALIWPTALALLAEIGIGFALCYYAGKQPLQTGSLWTIALIMAAILGGTAMLVGLTALPALVHSLRPTGIPALQIALLSVPFILATGYQQHLLLGTGHLAAFNACRLASGLGYPLGALVCLAMGWTTIPYFVAAFLVAQIGGCCLPAYFLTRITRLNFRADWPLAARVLRYGVKSYVSSIAAQTSLRLDQLLISMLLSSQELGYYAVATAAANSVSPVFSALSILIAERVVRIEDKAEGVMISATLIVGGIGAATPVIIAAIAATPIVLPLLLGTQYAPATFCTQLLFVASLFGGLMAVFGSALRSLGHPGLEAVAELGGGIGTVVLLPFMMPAFGIIGAAATSLIVYIGVNAAQVRFLIQASNRQFHELLAVAVQGCGHAIESWYRPRCADPDGHRL